MSIGRPGIAALWLVAACAQAQVNTITVAAMPALDAPPHERHKGDIKAHFVRLKSLVHPDRLANFQQDAQAQVSAQECQLIGEPKEPWPTDPDDRFLAYEDHYITERFHVTYFQSRQAIGPCKLKWQTYRKVTIQSFNGTTCIVDLSRPQLSRSRPGCSINVLEKAPAAPLPATLNLSKDQHPHAGHVCRYIEPVAAMGDFAKLHRRCVMDIAAIEPRTTAPAAIRGLLLRSETRLDPNGRHVDIMEAQRVEPGVGITRGVLLPHLQ